MNLKARFWGNCLAAATGLMSIGCADQAKNIKVGHPPLQTTLIKPVDAQSLGLRNVTSFDMYVDGDTVHAAFVATQSGGKQPFIGYLHSEDGGLHWSAPQVLSQQFNQPVESKAGNDIQVAATGDNLMVMWQTSGELPGMGPLLTVYSRDAGKTWQRGANPTGSEIDQSHHDLIADVEGRFHAVWLDDRDENGYQGVRYARSSDVGEHWELTKTIDDSSCSCCWNRLSIAEDGKISVLYRDMEFRDMALAQTADAGASWQRLGTVGAFNWKFDGCPHNGGGLSQAGDRGPLHAVVWTGAENKIGLYHMRSADSGKNWTPPQRIGEGTAGFHADIAASGERSMIVWDAMGPEGSQVFISESGDNGASWSPPRQLSANGSAEFPRIVATASGWLAMWSELQPGAGKQWFSAILQ